MQAIQQLSQVVNGNRSELMQAIQQLSQVVDRNRSELIQVIAENKSELMQVIQEVRADFKKELRGTKTELQRSIDDLAENVNEFATDTENRFSSLESDVKVIKSTMVTKPYLDEKLADLRGDMVVLTRKEDKKLNTLVEILADKKILTKKEQKQITSMEPFAS